MDSRDIQVPLIESARAGDRTAFDKLTAACNDRLATLVKFRLGESLRRELDPEDVLQDTYLRAFQTLDRFEQRSGDSFFRWLSGIARNVILERSRKVRHPVEIEDEGAENESLSPSGAVRRHERLERLQQAFDELSPDHRRVLRSVLVEKLPVADVARRLGKTPNAVSLILLRANRKLRESFGDTQSLGLPEAELDWGGTDDAQ